ncbi:MAG TPA: CBO0543 family protein [Chondromyces sp.]|nr:CBO0543 family protein [Chondromyces sp.]
MRKKHEVAFLSLTTFVSLILLPFAIVKRPFKDWLIVYLVSVIGNSSADRYLVSKGYLKYKTRPFPKRFSIHLPFDYIQYPLLLLYYNQWTLNSKPFGIFLKLFPFVIPQVIVETVAAKKSNLIVWKKGWTWYHSLFSLIAKFLLCRLIIAAVRKINRDEITIT